MFERLEQIITLKKANIFEHYHTGIEKGKIEAEFRRLGLTPTEGLISLYQWHNGLKDWDIPTGISSIFPFGVFVALETAVKAYEELTEALELVSPEYFPILVEDCIIINLNSRMENYGSMFILFPGMVIMEPIKIYSSLTSFIETQIACYKKGVITFNKRGKRVIDFKKMRQLSKHLNPDCIYWQLESLPT